MFAVLLWLLSFRLSLMLDEFPSSELKKPFVAPHGVNTSVLANLSCLTVWTWEQPLNLCLCHTLSCVAAFNAPLRLIGIFHELQLIWSDWNFAVLGFEAFGEKYGRIFEDSWGVVVQMKSDDSCNFFFPTEGYTPLDAVCKEPTETTKTLWRHFSASCWWRCNLLARHVVTDSVSEWWMLMCNE